MDLIKFVAWLMLIVSAFSLSFCGPESELIYGFPVL